PARPSDPIGSINPPITPIGIKRTNYEYRRIHMTAGALGEERPTLFLRKATGLVRGWSVRDSLIYACLATNFVTLGLYEFTFAGPAFPKGQLITSVIISGIWVSFLVIAYTGLVVTIPRAGGDYVWQTRILGSGI